MAKKTTKKAEEKPAVPALEPGAKVLGPGVVKRPKKDPAQQAPQADDIAYTPSEQVFRRR